MVKLLSFMLVLVALFSVWNTAAAQEKDFQAAVLQKLDEINKRIDEMDKRYEIRFTKIEERFNTIDERFNTIDERFNNIDTKIGAVNQRIDDKFNLLSWLLGLIVALLALPHVQKIFEKSKEKTEYQKDLQHIQEQIDELKAQLSQRPGPAR
jgi:tetrahydromethanopterin S-methyltransferase subunit G